MKNLLNIRYSMIKNIIFDFDGVLVDSEILVAKSLSRYLANKNIHFEEEEFSKFAGKKTIQIVSELSSFFNIKDEKLFLSDIMLIAERLYSYELKTVFGVSNFLKNTSHNRFIGSNNIKNRIIQGLKKVKLNSYFSANSIFSFDVIGIPKPKPDIFLKAIEEARIKTSETIIIEDSAIGIQAGVAAGIKVIGLTAGGHWYKNRSNQELYDAGAYKVVNNYSDMLVLVNKI